MNDREKIRAVKLKAMNKIQEGATSLSVLQLGYELQGDVETANKIKDEITEIDRIFKRIENLNLPAPH